CACSAPPRARPRWCSSTSTACTPTTSPPCSTSRASPCAPASTARIRCWSGWAWAPPAARRWPSTTRTRKSTPSSWPCARCAHCWPEARVRRHNRRMSALQFRTATETDVDAIVLLVTRAYRGEASRDGWTTEADLLDGARIDPAVLRHDITRPGSRVLLGLRDGAL